MSRTSSTRGRSQDGRFAAAQRSRRLGVALLVPTVLLTIGGVYCQMHYAVDALAGLAVGLGVVVATGARLDISAASAER